MCDVCDDRDPDKSHPVNNAIDGTERWWQSPPLSRGSEFNHVNVTIHLGQVSSTLSNLPEGLKPSGAFLIANSKRRLHSVSCFPPSFKMKLHRLVNNK